MERPRRIGDIWEVASTTASIKDRETVGNLNTNAAAILHKVSSEDLYKQVNNALGTQMNLLGKAPLVIAAKQHTE